MKLFFWLTIPAAMTVMLPGCSFRFATGQYSETPEVSNEQKRSYHIQLVSLDRIDPAYVDAAREELEREFPGVKVSVNQGYITLDDSLNLTEDKASAEQILKLLFEHKPEGVDTYLGITYKNIALRERILSDGSCRINSSVLGLGSLRYGVAVCSYQRVPEKRHFKKVVVHEVCHTLGIHHCDNRSCTMINGDGSSKPIRNSQGLCNDCRTSAFRQMGLPMFEI